MEGGIVGRERRGTSYTNTVPRQASAFTLKLPCSKERPGWQRRTSQILYAKKSKGKGGKQKKGPGSLMDNPEVAKPAEEVSLEPWQELNVITGNLLLVESYSRNVGSPLLEGDVELTDISQELWEAPFALLAHDFPEEKGQGEPLFSYANKTALELFEAEWEDLVGKPSSISADKDAQEDRSQALGSALDGGKLESYAGWRKSLKGKRFQIQGATLFNIQSPTGEVLGQGAKIGQWRFEDDTLGGPDVPADTSMPEPSDITAAETAVEEQANEVRSLKEGRGLGNSDPDVEKAVSELLKRKAKLKTLLDRLALSEGKPVEE